MLPYFTNFYGNPHSRTHAYGWESETAMENARKVHNQENTYSTRAKFSAAVVHPRFVIFQQVASVIGAETKEVVFTSGATESNNVSIKGVARFYKSKKKHIITTQTVCLCCRTPTLSFPDHTNRLFHPFFRIS